MKSCLESKQRGGFSFVRRFEVANIAISDKLVKSGQAQVAAVVSFRLKVAYDPHQPLTEDEMWWGSLIGPASGKPGDIVSNNLRADFQKWDKGWRINCGN